jgi:hypothetical protein
VEGGEEAVDGKVLGETSERKQEEGTAFSFAKRF